MYKQIPGVVFNTLLLCKTVHNIRTTRRQYKQSGKCANTTRFLCALSNGHQIVGSQHALGSLQHSMKRHPCQNKILTREKNTCVARGRCAEGFHQSQDEFAGGYTWKSYKNKVWRAELSWIFRARMAWWSHLQARRRSLRAC